MVPDVPDVAEQRETEILLVDDDARNLLAIETALAGVAKVVPAQSGTGALRRLLDRDFALILLDVQMPSMDGFETAALIRSRARSRNTPIIFVTAYQRADRDILRAYALGAVDFLFKPLVPEVLRAKATVFVALQQERARVARQVELLRAHEIRERARVLAEERRTWEERALREQMEEQSRASDELARKAEELTRSIAEREDAQRALARMNDELLEANRRKDQFLAVLSHELRNPLAPLVHGLELLRLHLEESPRELAVPLEAIHASLVRQAGTLGRLVDDLLDVSRIDRGKIALRLDRVDLEDAARQAVATVRPALDERTQTLVFEPVEERIHVRADPVRLVQILANVLSNASRYTEAEGRIEVRCSRAGDEGVVRIADTGQGIAPELLPRIFDMFVQQPGGRDGLGLGLTLARALVEQHGGHIEAQSDGPGCGSTFSIRLPVATAPVSSASRPVSPRRAAKPSSRPRHRVVVVDDQDDVRESLCALLRLWGHEVADAADGEEGVETILRLEPDIAFVDIGMPKLDGYAVATRVREALGAGALRLVALTGFGQKSDEERAFDAGFDGHLVKPTEPDVLARVFEDLATQKRSPPS